MLFNSFLKSFRILLLPFALLYWLIVWIRNGLYDKKIISSTSFALPIICVGNLAVGGTGKSPMTEYLIRLLKDKYAVATLSRGYKRRTKGYVLANENTTALDIGDEPMQFFLKFPDIAVAVGEERVVSIPLLLHDRPEVQAVILDDAFQHRAITAGLNILLTDYSNLFVNDFHLPVGDLRDIKSSYKRADIIVVTKCKAELSIEDKESIIRKIKPYPHQVVYFTAIAYGAIYHHHTREQETLTKEVEALLISGIANPKPLKKYMEATTKEYHLLQYSDHHIFTIDDLKEIKKEFSKIQSPNKLIVTTEKDAVRLTKFKEELDGLPLYVLPIRHQFLFNEGAAFDEKVIQFVRDFKGITQ